MQAPLGSPRGFFAGVSAGVSAGSPGVSAGSPRQFSWGLRGVSGVLRGSPRQGGTQNIIEHSYVHETPHAQKPYFFIQNVLVGFVRVTAEPPEMYVVASLKSVCAASL